MSYRVLMFISRKDGTSPEEFKDYYEGFHVKLIERISGSSFPLSHSRTYMGYVPTSVQPGAAAAEGEPPAGGDERVKTAVNLLAGGTGAAAANVPMIVQGTPADFDWDACTMLTWTNETHFREFMACLMDPANAKALADDEEVFADRAKFRAVILGENRTTGNHSWAAKDV